MSQDVLSSQRLPFKNNMNRTFHRRVTLQDIAAIALHAICAFACFWQHTGAWAIIGACLAMTALVAIERAIHTTYVITDEGILHILQHILHKYVA